jgi:hypothetical protein
MGLAVAALCLSLLPWMFRGSSFMQFNDADTGRPIGFVRAEYGVLTIARFNKTPGSQDELSRVELQLKDDGLTVELHNKGLLPAKWVLSRETGTFTRIGGAPSHDRP